MLLFLSCVLAAPLDYDSYHMEINSVIFFLSGVADIFLEKGAGPPGRG